MDLGMVVPIIMYVGALLSCALSLQRPQAGVYYLVIVLPLQALRYDLHAFPLGASVIDITLLGVALGIFLQRREPIFADLPMKRLLLASAAYLYLSMWLGSISVGLGWPLALSDPRFTVWKSYVEMSVFFAASFAAIKTARQIQAVLALMCLSVLYVSYDFFQAMYEADLSSFQEGLRQAAMAGNQMGYAGINGFAAFECVLALFLLGYYNSRLSPLLKAFVLLALVGSIYGVLFAFSRGAYLALAAGVVLMGLLHKRSFLIVGVAAALIAVMALPAVRERINGTYVQSEGSSDTTLESSAQERVIIWQDALELIKASPWVGSGFDTYRYMHRSLGYGDTHNYYLKVLVEQGVLGLMLFLAVVWRMFLQGYELFRRTVDPLSSSLGMGFCVCIAGAAVVNVFGDRWTYQQVDSYLWILLAIVCRARLLRGKAETECRLREEADSQGSVFAAVASLAL